MARYIDADKAKREFNIGFGGVSHAVIANQIIDSIPTADVEEVKHGEWLMCLSDEPWRKGYHGRCSECGAFYTYNINKMPRRCDNCDAKMDRGNNV